MAMKPEEIVPGGTYKGGKSGERRTVTDYGSSEVYVVWAPTHKRLPLGAFLRSESRCTSRASFAKWANERV